MTSGGTRLMPLAELARFDDQAPSGVEDLRDLWRNLVLAQRSNRRLVQVHAGDPVGGGGGFRPGERAHLAVELSRQIRARAEVDGQPRDGQQHAEGQRPLEREPGTKGERPGAYHAGHDAPSFSM